MLMHFEIKKGDIIIYVDNSLFIQCQIKNTINLARPRYTVSRICPLLLTQVSLYSILKKFAFRKGLM